MTITRLPDLKIAAFTIHLAIIAALLAGAAFATQASAQTAGEETFKTPQAAAAALFQAAKNRDKPMALKVLGANSESLFNTGDRTSTEASTSYSSTSTSRCIGW